MLVAICPVALITGLFFGGLCFGKHTIILLPLDMADHVQDLCSLRTHSQCSYWETVREERDMFHERYNSDNRCESSFTGRASVAFRSNSVL